MQFQNQLAAVEMATPLERMGSWKISPMMTQPAGPQVLEDCQQSHGSKILGLNTYEAKKKINRHTKTIKT